MDTRMASDPAFAAEVNALFSTFADEDAAQAAYSASRAQLYADMASAQQKKNLVPAADQDVVVATAEANKLVKAATDKREQLDRDIKAALQAQAASAHRWEILRAVVGLFMAQPAGQWPGLEKV